MYANKSNHTPSKLTSEPLVKKLFKIVRKSIIFAQSNVFLNAILWQWFFNSNSFVDWIMSTEYDPIDDKR